MSSPQTLKERLARALSKVEYHTARKVITLPKLKCLEKKDDED